MIKERDAADAAHRSTIAQMQESLDKAQSVNDDLLTQIESVNVKSQEARAEYQKLQAVCVSAQDEVLAWQTEHSALSTEVRRNQSFPKPLNPTP
jgi:predicted  nucleic acid-binding Zn-ribbon protein